MQPQDEVIDEQSFIAKYWHPNTHMVTVINPTNEDYEFQATVDAGIDLATGKPKPEQRRYRVPAGGSERFPGSIANMYLDQMSRLLAQKDERLDRLVDFSEKAKYYDQLTADMEDTIAAYIPNPAFEVAQATAMEQKTEETPFAGANEDPKTASKPPKVNQKA